MRTTRQQEGPVTVLRWNGQEIKYNEGDRQFINEMLGHNLKMKNAQVLQIQETHREGDWQCVIVDLKEPLDFYDTPAGADALQVMMDNAKPEQFCFMLTYKREDHQKLLQSRNRNKGNLFDLFMGYKRPGEPEDSPEPEPTIA